MPFRSFIDRRNRERKAHDLYVAVVGQSRRPEFYEVFGVPDNVDGRFDMIIVHAFLVMRRLGRIEGSAAEEAKALSQAVFDLMFADMDQNLREMGVGDMKIGKRVHQMAEAFYGRVSAYEMAMGEGGDALAEALARNIMRKPLPEITESAHGLAAYVISQDSALARQDGVVDGKVDFGEVGLRIEAEEGR